MAASYDLALASYARPYETLVCSREHRAHRDATTRVEMRLTIGGGWRPMTTCDTLRERSFNAATATNPLRYAREPVPGRSFG